MSSEGERTSHECRLNYLPILSRDIYIYLEMRLTHQVGPSTHEKLLKMKIQYIVFKSLQSPICGKNVFTKIIIKIFSDNMRFVHKKRVL